MECACDYYSVSCVQWSCVRNQCIVLATLRSASRVCSSNGIALCVSWSGDRSRFGCLCDVFYFFFLEELAF